MLDLSRYFGATSTVPYVTSHPHYEALVYSPSIYTDKRVECCIGIHGLEESPLESYSDTKSLEHSLEPKVLAQMPTDPVAYFTYSE